MNISRFAAISSFSSTIAEKMDGGTDHYAVVDQYAPELLSVHPEFAGIAIELFLNQFYEEWMNQSPAKNYDLTLSDYMAAKLFGVLDDRDR